MQRTEERIEAVIPFRLVRGRQTSWVQTVDVSRNALFFATEESFDPRSLLRIRFDACGQDLDAFCTVVRQGICRGVRGTAVRFYACSDQMREVWDRFVGELERGLRTVSQEVDATYVVRMSQERLSGFAERHLQASLPYRILTAARRPEGSEVTLRIEHPESRLSFDLTADVVRSWSEDPAGMEMSVRELSSDDLEAFKGFVESGRLELPSWLVLGNDQYGVSLV